MCLSHPQTILPTPGPWKNYLPQSQSLGDKAQGNYPVKLGNAEGKTKPL